MVAPKGGRPYQIIHQIYRPIALADQKDKPAAGTKIAIIGSGSWATALVKILTEGNVRLQWWVRLPEDADYIRQYHHNPRYLADVQIPTRKVKVTHKVKDALKGADYVILVTPAAFIQEALSSCTAADFAGKTVITAIKGLIPDLHLLVTDWVEQTFAVPQTSQCIIAGPCHAEEVAMERLSYLTLASPSQQVATEMADMLRCRFVHASTNADLYGTEFCAVMKNVVALVSGICHGLGYGDNFQAVLVSNAILEMERFLQTVSPAVRNMGQSAYLGDLLVTAYSQFSRNRTFGNMIGRGYSVASAQMEMNMVAEGYYAVNSLWRLNQTYAVEMPILEAAYQILYNKHPAQQEITKLQDTFK